MWDSKYIYSYQNLRVVSVCCNHVSGGIPAAIFNSSTLRAIYLDDNELSGNLPSDMCHNLPLLEVIHLHDNQLNGEIPSNLSECSNLKFLQLTNNSLSGQIPASIGKLQSLQQLSLGHNRLTGEIPQEIGNLHNLFALTIEENQISGTLPLTNELREIPPSICKLEYLVILQLSRNFFEGQVPRCLGNLNESLQVLHLRGNHFHGLIPSIFTENCSIQSLDLNGNQFGGILPPSLAHCQKLQVLDIGNNRIQDTFPFWTETLLDLQVLVLRSNGFYGSLLSTLKTRAPFSKLQVFDISQNEFVGSLPERYLNSFRAMIDAKENMTDYNRLIYFESIDLVVKGLEYHLERMLTTFTTIDMSVNNFSGSIPGSLEKLNSLRYLNLSHNNLIGHLPSSLGNMSALESLDLSSNQLTSEIPSQLTQLTFLAVLNLSINNLEGRIPQSHQFNTFGNDSYAGNKELCGFPLTKKCEEDSPLRVLPQDDDYGFLDGLTWKVVVYGYGCGVVIGISMGYLVLQYGWPKWLVESISDVEYYIKRRGKRNVVRRRRS